MNRLAEDPPGRHREIEPAGGGPPRQWSSESLLESGAWQVSAPEESDSRAAAARSWQPSVSLGSRLRRAISTPVVAGVVLLIASIVVAVVMTLLQGHGVAGAASPALATDAGSGSAVGASSEAEGIDGDNAPGGAGAIAGGTNQGDASAAALFVHVVGEVKSPGVVELPGGSRVQDAIAAVGGATDAAELTGVNLARVVADGEQLLIPNAQEAALLAASGGGAGSGGAAGSGDGGAGGAEGGADSGSAGQEKVNINTANAAALEELTGVGPAIAQRIVEWREANGRFATPEQLMEVSGIGAKTFEGMREQVAV